ncbi:hypothetical protein L2E82_20867 [Cichorium intybus]|uniref:Uncharacterized protein n=1 Tax=Cichorium intybus TaxID=13427 RepID=A0ACB9DU33_CICIN|nr:hypothetical protein L2E82_20867 [Cichorium intybus]
MTVGGGFQLMYRKAVSLDEYVSCINNIDPLSPYKTWTIKQPCNDQRNSSNSITSFDVTFERVKADFVVSDPVDWSRDIQLAISVQIFSHT